MADTIQRRQTRQRVAVSHALEGLDDFRSAQEIHELLRAGGESVGLTTVYRSLQALADEGLVDVIVRSDGESVYRQCSTHHHHHLVCRSCRSAVEVDAPSVESWAARVADEHGFTEVSHTVEVFGLCPRCSR
ncbi:MAG: Fur family transcriptional regulator [Actinomycetota bacterium]